MRLWLAVSVLGIAACNVAPPIAAPIPLAPSDAGTPDALEVAPWDSIGWRPSREDSGTPADHPEGADAAPDNPTQVADAGTVITTRLCLGNLIGDDPMGCRYDRRCNGAGQCVSRFTEFPVPTSRAALVGIAAGPDGNVWFAEAGADQIGRLSPSGDFAEFPAPELPQQIVSGPDGRLWFTLASTSAIGRITTGGVVTLLSLPPTIHGASCIVTGPDGNIWFTAWSGAIGTVTATDEFKVFNLPTKDSNPSGITVGSDGNLWFVEGLAGQIGRITIDGTITEFTTPIARSRVALWSITAGRDGHLWFTAPDANAVGRLTVSGVATTFALSSLGSPVYTQFPAHIVSAPDGNLWVTAAQGNKLVRITPTGFVTEFPIPSTAPGPDGLAVGPDGALWFTEQGANKIGRFQLD